MLCLQETPRLHHFCSQLFGETQDFCGWQSQVTRRDLLMQVRASFLDYIMLYIYILHILYMYISAGIYIYDYMYIYIYIFFYTKRFLFSLSLSMSTASTNHCFFLKAEGFAQRILILHLKFRIITGLCSQWNEAPGKSGIHSLVWMLVLWDPVTSPGFETKPEVSIPHFQYTRSYIILRYTLFSNIHIDVKENVSKP